MPPIHLNALAAAALLAPAALAQTSDAQAQEAASKSPAFDAAVKALQQDFDRRLAELEKRLAADEQEMREKDTAIEKKITDNTSSEAAVKAALKGKWYERLSLRGYTQFRYTTLFDNDYTPNLTVPNDPSVSETETLNIRRGRFTVSGDVSEHVFLYGQLDYYGSVGGTGDKGLQARDLYADIALDSEKEYRFRVGMSKVPYGFVNMQSSQNRAAMERPDALNSAAEGERDFGAYFYWAPKEIRDLFKKLVKDGLKGSGDYGVFGIGAYSGQGPNRSDLNGEMHWVARAAYPYQFDNGQVLELGIQGYMGDFVVATQAIGAGPAPTADANGIDDERVGVSAVLYPQPFGFEAEWNWGRGPQLQSNLGSIDVESLHGGYLQANYLLATSRGNVFPFVRWNYYDGARKFGKNAPWDVVNEFDLGFEWSPWPELEFSLMYTHTFERTDTSTAPYDKTEDANRVGFQVQWNY